MDFLLEVTALLHHACFGHNYVYDLHCVYHMFFSTLFCMLSSSAYAVYLLMCCTEQITQISVISKINATSNLKWHMRAAIKPRITSKNNGGLMESFKIIRATL